MMEFVTKGPFQVPTKARDKDEFHITTEEYLQALISLIEELVWMSSKFG